jgi:hypothetical protein
MDTGLIVAIVLLSLTLIGAGVGIFFAWRGMYKGSWQFVPGTLARYDANCNVSPQRLSAALQIAINAVATHTTVSLIPVLPKLYITVNPEEKWVDRWGRTIAGYTMGYAVTTNASLASLCHEVLHAVEFETKAGPDDAHATWTGNGFFAACDDYQERLKRV